MLRSLRHVQNVIRTSLQKHSYTCPCSVISFQYYLFCLGELISPKEFTIRANKDKQKDWKGSIRIGKSNMRYSDFSAFEKLKIFAEILLYTLYD